MEADMVVLAAAGAVLSMGYESYPLAEVVVVQDAVDLSVEVKTLAAESLVGLVAGSMINSGRLTQIRGLPEMQL